MLHHDRQAHASHSSSKLVVYAALGGNLMVALTKFGAAWWTGSSAMLSEALHSLVDTSNQLLLLYGMYRADRPPDETHPFGHGRELYFWSFVVAILMFALGAGAALYEGVNHIRHPAAIVDPAVSYVVLALSFVFEGSTWSWRCGISARPKAISAITRPCGAARTRRPSWFCSRTPLRSLGLVIAFLGTFAAS